MFGEFHQNMVALSKHFIFYQMLTDLLEILYINTSEYFGGSGWKLVTFSFNFDFVPKLCNQEVEKYTFFLSLTNVPKEMVIHIERIKDLRHCDALPSVVIFSPNS